MIGVRELFRDKQQTEFIIATIPTSLGVRESDRLARALQREQIPCRRIIVNQVCCLLPCMTQPCHEYVKGTFMCCRMHIDWLAENVSSEGPRHDKLCVWQVIEEHMGAAFLKLKLRDQEKSMHLLESDPSLSSLNRLQVSLCCISQQCLNSDANSKFSLLWAEAEVICPWGHC